jgi:hypothetical protein
MAGVLRLLTPGELPPAGVERFRVALTGPAIAILTVGIWLAACCWVWWMGGLEKVKIPSALCGWAVFWIGPLLALSHQRAVQGDARRCVGRGTGARRRLCEPAVVPQSRAGRAAHARGARALRGHRAGARRAARGGGGDRRRIEPLRRAEARERRHRRARGEARRRAERPGASPLARMLWKSSPVVIADRAVRIGWRANPSASVFLDRLARRGVTVAQPWAHIMMRAS